MNIAEALRQRKEADRLARDIRRKNANDFAEAAEAVFEEKNTGETK